MEPAGKNHTTRNGKPVKHKSAHHNAAYHKSQYIRQHEKIQHNACASIPCISAFSDISPPFPVKSMMEDEKNSHNHTQPFMELLTSHYFRHQNGDENGQAHIHRHSDLCFRPHSAVTSSPRPLIQLTISSREEPLLNLSPSNHMVSDATRL